MTMNCVLYIVYFFAHITVVDLKKALMNTAFYIDNSILSQMLQSGVAVHDYHRRHLFNKTD